MPGHRTGRSSQLAPSFVEPLEGRCLLSNAPVALLTPDAPAPAAIRVAPHGAAAKSHIPNVVGKFTGRIKVKKWFVSKSFDVDMIVTSQTGNKVAGTVTVEHLGSKIPFTGTVNVKRNMVVKFDKSGYKGTLTGHVSANGRLIEGDGKAKGTIDLDGDLKLNKVGK